ncbi:hypothetical protein HAX54_049490 [Datura stramonium]|uniref:Uncharacterized protein n=1 Tax=Datura stramonium TaxID=4076 RepID=A0ABS8RRE2_DATST|nr:hypothetical protein [Datura stramonium]
MADEQARNLDAPQLRGIIEMLNDAALLKEVESLKSTIRVSHGVTTEILETEDGEFDYELIARTVWTAVNGSQDVQKQGVQVAYLNYDQVLVLPTALGLDPLDEDNSEATHDPSLIARYNKCTGMTYQEIFNLVEPIETIAVKRELRPNINSRVSDSAWANVANVPVKRFVPQVHSYTLDQIAALNYSACNGWPLGAWIRAFGVGCGLLPSRDTLLNKEWKFTRAFPSDAHF